LRVIALPRQPKTATTSLSVAISPTIANAAIAQSDAPLLRPLERNASSSLLPAAAFTVEAHTLRIVTGHGQRVRPIAAVDHASPVQSAVAAMVQRDLRPLRLLVVPHSNGAVDLSLGDLARLAL